MPNTFKQKNACKNQSLLKRCAVYVWEGKMHIFDMTYKIQFECEDVVNIYPIL